MAVKKTETECRGVVLNHSKAKTTGLMETV